MIERLTKRNSNGDVASHVDPQKRHMLFVNRLAAYEDSGLSPEEVQKMALAKAEGRLVVLPCKVGDIVYADCYGDIIGCEVHQIEMRTGKPTQYIARGDDEGYGVPEIDFVEDDIGKTVFLTREEAEKALQGRLAYVVCHYCFGKGSLEGEGYAECPYCDGTGFEPVDDMMDDMTDDEIELLEAGE